MFAAACSGRAGDAPTAPTGAVSAPAQLPARSGTALPFKGSFSAIDKGVVTPPNLEVEGTGGGEATHLGRYTATYSAVAPLGGSTATGSFDFSAANGDHLFATFAGTAVNIEPGIVEFTEVLTIVGGTGRFVAATGTFTLRRTGRLDVAAGTSSSSGSFEGSISLPK
jgi:hypothetical protein